MTDFRCRTRAAILRKASGSIRALLQRHEIIEDARNPQRANDGEGDEGTEDGEKDFSCAHSAPNKPTCNRCRKA